MAGPYKILIMGASYGALLGMKLKMAGHAVCLVCLPEEAALINSEGQTLRIPVRGQPDLLEIHSSEFAGVLRAAAPNEVDPLDFDLVALAMQEPQYRSPGVRELLAEVGTSRVPCMSIMNMPPLPYLARIPGLDTDLLRECYTDPSVWDSFDPATITLASPDPQAFRPPAEKSNLLQVSLPTNFKVARFESEAATAMLREMQADVEAVRYDLNGETLELPVKLKVHDSVFVPLAKWSMLLTGNYRCVQSTQMRPIREAVHSDLERSRAIYTWVGELCQSLGADPADMVPFEKYANAAKGLALPSSAARALAAGVPNIERVDRLVSTIAKMKGAKSQELDAIVELVEGWLKKNRSAAS